MISYLGMAPAQMPMALGTPAQFEILRAYLEECGYTEEVVAPRLGITSFANFGSIKRGTRAVETLAQPVNAMIQMFLECEPVPKADLEQLVPARVLGAMNDLGLLRATTDYPPQITATVGICPTRGLYLASDMGGELGKLAEDVVYPAILENTQSFLAMIPEDPCDRFLDLGAGTGVAAIYAARNYAKHAWASDITARSTYFAEFNRRLNGLDNVTAVRGDMYGAVADLQFDRIVTHPPYVPVSKATHVFRDGGDDGEQILRRAIEGLPQVLAPGGQFYAQSLISDREDDETEARIRRWLGPENQHFDVALFLDSSLHPYDFIGKAMQKGTHRSDELQYWASVFRNTKTALLLYGGIVIQRHKAGEQREAFTSRLIKGPRAGLKETAWALEWLTAARQPGALDLILQSKPACSEHLHLGVMHKAQERKLVPREFLLRVKLPFEVECKCPGWVAEMLGLCDGERTGQEIMELLIDQGTIEPDTLESEFAAVLRTLISSAFLELESYPIPAVSKTN